MVLVHLKRQEEDLLLARFETKDTVADVRKELVLLNNLRIRLVRLAEELKGLAQYGPILPLVDQQPDEPVGEVPDPSGRRCGNPPEEEFQKQMFELIEHISIATNTNRISKKECVQLDELTILLQQSYDLAARAYPDTFNSAPQLNNPKQLPENEPIRLILANAENFDQNSEVAKQIFDPERSILWWAGKKLDSQKQLKDYFGPNEKTKVIIKITKEGSGAPPRESPLSAQDQQNMIAYYHRMQREQERMEKEADEDFSASQWADPKSLKNAFLGLNISKPSALPR
eukprot:GCRY01005384.1.p1 GENE.GCRY01005384.1~~GCRY01005384.1.p1  ORF type:complete len:286 (-),score=69.47 GCRY01005384.1:71-928(-)